MNNTSNVVIKVENIGKQYIIGKREDYLTLRDKLIELPRQIFKKNKKQQFWALKNVSFEIKRGEVLGIIGKNGAGKSTLLKILSRITEPTVGKITMQGRVASMLEVGTGFNPELTGRENIYLNGAILGMSSKAIREKFDDILEFSGVGKFIDTPVKHYSSGMQVRLAFAVSAHLESDIMIIDEVLAVGDQEFQKKCLGKMGNLTKSGRTIIFVSHNMTSIQNLCTSVLLVDHGNIISHGQTNKMIKKYLTMYSSPQNKITLTDQRLKRTGSGLVKFSAIKYFTESKPTDTLLSGKNTSMELSYTSKINKKLDNVNVSLGIDDEMGTRLFILSTELTGETFAHISQIGKIKVDIHKLPLNSGTYTISLFMRVNGIISDWIINACEFKVGKGDYYGTGKTHEGQGSMLIDHQFHLISSTSSETML